MIPSKHSCNESGPVSRPEGTSLEVSVKSSRNAIKRLMTGTNAWPKSRESRQRRPVFDPWSRPGHDLSRHELRDLPHRGQSGMGSEDCRTLGEPAENGRSNCRQRSCSNRMPRLSILTRRFFESDQVRMLPLTIAVCERAAQIRAASSFRLKVPDCLHLAAAVEAGCSLFLTNDQQLSQYHGVPVEILE
jgi:hypothetical protein